MNTIAFEIRPRDGFVPEVRVLIDGKDLIEALKLHEAPFALAEGHPGIAGGYSGLMPEEWKTLPEAYSDGRVAVMGCECGEVSCWAIRVAIVTEVDRVIWRDFQQPQRPSWTYQGLGPFAFDRTQYESAVASLHGSQREQAGDPSGRDRPSG